MTDGSRVARERRHRRRGLLARVAAVVVVAGAGSGAGLALSADSGPAYRVAGAGTGSVTQTVATVGTIGTVDTSVASFPVSGTVATVNVAPGDQVSGGQTLATLDTSSLRQQLNSADATLAAAKQTLAGDEAAQSGSGTSSQDTTQSAQELALGPAAPPRSGSPSKSGSSSGSSGSGSGAAEQAVARAQHEVSAAQADLDRALAGLGVDLRKLGSACSARPASPPAPITYPATVGSDGTIGGTARPDDTVTLWQGSSQVGEAQHGAYSFTGLTTGASYTVRIQPATPAAAVDASACAAAVQSAIASYGTAGARGFAPLTAALSSAEHGLDAAVRTLHAAPHGQAPSSGGRSAAPSASSPQGKSSGGGRSSGSQTSPSGSRGGAGREVTSQQLAADQAAIDAAQAQVGVAQQNLDQATLSAPVAGTVGAVGLAAGDTVGASSTRSTITIVGRGAKQVSVTVSLADIDRVKVGERAQVEVDGVSGALSGKVVSIGVLSTTTGSATSYPVKILLDPSVAKLYDGSGASVSIVVTQVRDVLTVPSSAVHHTGGLATVTVLRKGKPTTVRVTTGAVGADLTEIRSGLSAGDQVVLADLHQPLPSNGTPSRNGLFGGDANRGGGAFRRLGGR